MEAVIFVGIQGAGKSTFFKRNFFDTHIRINLDMLRTKNREKLIFEACLEAKQKFVVDKTNLTREEREKYILQAINHGFKIVGYYFQADLKKAIERNNQRSEKAKVPEKAILVSFKRLQIPEYDEGFSELFYVSINDENEFIVKNWEDEI
jgi:predicted kinase